MRKIKATAGFGFGDVSTHEEEFEFPDEYTDKEIEYELWDWAQQFVELDYEEIDDEEDVFSTIDCSEDLADCFE